MVAQSNSRLASHRLEQAQVLRREFAALPVEHLQHADDLPFDCADRRAQDALRDVACFFVDGPIETGVGVCVLDDGAFALGEYGTGNPLSVEDPDLPKPVAQGDARVQLPSLVVVQKQRASIRVSLLCAYLDNRAQQLVESVDDGDLFGHAQQQLHFLKLLSLVDGDLLATGHWLSPVGCAEPRSSPGVAYVRPARRASSPRGRSCTGSSLAPALRAIPGLSL